MKLDNHTLAKLAREVAMSIKPRADLLKDYELTQQEYDEVEKIPFYKHALDQMTIEWNKPLSTPERIKLTSQAGLEDNLLVVSGRARDPSEPLPAAVEVLKLLARIGGVDGTGKDQQQIAPTDRFVITINMGGDIEHYDKSVAVEKDDSTVKVIEHKQEA